MSFKFYDDGMFLSSLLRILPEADLGMVVTQTTPPASCLWAATLASRWPALQPHLDQHLPEHTHWYRVI